MQGPESSVPAGGSSASGRGGRAWRSLAAMLLVAIVLAGPLRAAAYGHRFAGQPLAEALAALQAGGLPLVYSSRLVRPEMRVGAEPASTATRPLVDELLRPHGLVVRETDAGRWVVVRRGREAVVPGVEGQVLSAVTGEVIGGAEVALASATGRCVTGADGRFHLHGLGPGRHTLEVRHPGFQRLRQPVKTAPGERGQVILELRPVAVGGEEIVVSSSDPRGVRAGALLVARRDSSASGFRDRDLGESLRGLPGVVGTESSSEIRVRGGRADEVMVVLDGQEILQPYHLRDFGSPLSVVAGPVAESLTLHRGDLPVVYGDRMSGVLELTSRVPGSGGHVDLALGRDSLLGGASGSFGSGRGRWLLALRRGSPEVVSEIGESDEKPSYADGFGKLLFAADENHEIAVHLLAVADDFDFTSELEEFMVRSRNRIAWLSHRAAVGPGLVVESKLDHTEDAHDRTGVELAESFFAIEDRRRSSRTGLRQEWTSAQERRQWRWGFEARRDEASYFYENRLPESYYAESWLPARADDALPPMPPADLLRSLATALRGDHVAAFAAQRFEPRPWLTADLGVRYDRTTLVAEEIVSPRLSLVAERGGSIFRFAWGSVSQSQRPYELQVPDGEVRPWPAERSEHLAAGWERALGGISVAVDAYLRRVSQPRPRFFNLFKPISRFPEIEVDRQMLAPSHSAAHGIELALGGRLGRRLDWRLAGAASRARDTVGGRQVPHVNDQPYSVRLDLGWWAPGGWQLTGRWLAHSGWPTTPVTWERIPSSVPGATNEPGDAGGSDLFQPVLGPLLSARLPTFHSLDLAASREWQWRRVRIGLELLIENLYDHRNSRGFDTHFTVVPGPDGRPAVVGTPELGRGTSPSFSLRLGW